MKKIGADSTAIVAVDQGDTELKLIARSQQVRERVNEIKSDLTNKTIELARLLKEAKDNDYHLLYGYARWGDWVNDEAGVDIKQREAYYLVQIVERADALGIPDSELAKVGVSKLKQIMSLPVEQGDLVKQLMGEAETLPLSTIKEAVEIAKGSEFTFMNFKILRTVRDTVVLPAFERIRREFGNTVDQNGEIQDISDGRCLELACANVLNEPVEQSQEVVDAEFEDVVEVE